MGKSIISLLLGILIFSACQNRYRKIGTSDWNYLVKTSLGNSGYQVKIPANMQLSVSEFKVPASDHIFNFCNPDSLPPFCNFLGIVLKGRDSIHAFGFHLPVIEQVQSKVLKTTISWNIHKSDNGFYVADARLRDMEFISTSVTLNGIDSMISLVSTLSYK